MQRRNLEHLPARVWHDKALKREIARFFAESFAVYGPRKVWQQRMQVGFTIARCMFARLI